MSAFNPSAFAAAAPLPAPDPAIRPAAAPAGTRRYEARAHLSLEAIAPVWQAMQRDGLCTVFQRLDWVDDMAAHLAAPARAKPIFVEIFDAETRQSVMLMPFAFSRYRTHSELAWLDLDVCDYAAPVLARGFAPGTEDARQAWDAALSVLPAADLLHIRQIPLRLSGAANPLAALAGLRRMETRCFGMALDGDPENLLKRICSSGTNKTIARRTRKLEKEGAIRFAVASGAAEVEELYAALVAMRRQRFGEIGRFDLLDRSEIEAFYLDAALRGLRDGPARLFGLSVGGVWIAVQLAFLHDNALHCAVIGISNDWLAHSPGIKLLSEIMVWSRRKGLGYFDLSVGDMAYKATLGAQATELFEIAAALTLRGAMVAKARRFAAASKAWLQRCPGLFEPLRDARRALRRWKALATGTGPGHSK